MCWMDFHNAILRCGFLCTLLIPALFVSILFYGNHAEGYHAPSLPPRAITPVYASQLSRHSIFLLIGCHTRAITLHHTRTSGYHTRHSSSYFVVYLSPATINTPPVLLHLHHHRAPHVPTYSTPHTIFSAMFSPTRYVPLFDIMSVLRTSHTIIQCNRCIRYKVQNLSINWARFLTHTSS